MASSLKSLGLGRALYQIYYHPLAWIDALFAAGGPWEQRRTEAGRRAMEVAAHALPPLPPTAGAPLELHLLTGRRFWFQTAFCLWTLARQSGRPLAPVIYDDGSLEAPHRDSLTRLFPKIRFVAQDESIARLDQFLPIGKFPHLRERWQNYPNLRKLTDPHIGDRDWKFVLDSDLLFFRRPEFLIDWIDHPTRPLHAVDCETSYGYTRPLMHELAGAPIAERVNVGLTGLNSTELDWDRIEHWCAVLITRERTNYFLEQALVAMLVANRECAIAPASDYVTLPVEPETTACRAVMHHYVANSKRWYFQNNWSHSIKC